MTDARFFIDHGMIHDRATGKHVTTDEDSVFCDGANACCALLNELAGSALVMLEALQLAEELHRVGALNAPDGLWDRVHAARRSALQASGGEK
jgi:hypothetical protein